MGMLIVSVAELQASVTTLASRLKTLLPQEWYCSDICANADWKIHRPDCKHKGKTAPPFGVGSLPLKEADSQETPASVKGEKKNPLPPRREFREDGTVKIINAYKPDPQIYKGLHESRFT